MELSTESLEISFRYLPGGQDVKLLEATLPSGAKFVLDVSHLPGKLGANLQLFHQAIKASHRTEGTVNALTVKPPTWEGDVKYVAPGTAYGVNGELDRSRRERARLAKHRQVQDALDQLEIVI